MIKNGWHKYIGRYSNIAHYILEGRLVCSRFEPTREMVKTSRKNICRNCSGVVERIEKYGEEVYAGFMKSEENQFKRFISQLKIEYQQTKQIAKSDKSHWRALKCSACHRLVGFWDYGRRPVHLCTGCNEVVAV